MPPPNSGKGFSPARDLTLAPTVWMCCSRCVSVLKSSTGCVRVLAKPALAADAVAILPMSDPLDVVEEEPLDEIDERA